MTALAIIRAEHMIIIASDGAGYDEATGLLLTVKSKVELFPEWPGFIACRGVGIVNPLLRYWLGCHSIGGFDDSLRQLPTAAKDVHDQLKAQHGGDCRFSVFVGGWSHARGAFETHVLRSRSFDIPGETVPPYELRPLPWIHLAPTAVPDVAARFGFVPPERLPLGEELDGAVYAIRSICAARSTIEGDNGFHSIGAFVQLTVIGRDGVESRIVHRWPDRIGERIDASVGDPLPAYLAT